jgi:hypothetical protein
VGGRRGLRKKLTRRLPIPLSKTQFIITFLPASALASTSKSSTFLQRPGEPADVRLGGTIHRVKEGSGFDNGVSTK